MIKVAISADHHFNSTSRFDECIRIHEWMADDMIGRDVDLFLSAGDVYERKSNPEERLAVASWLQKIGNHCQVVIVKGNHDADKDLALMSEIKSVHGIHVVDYPTIMGTSVGIDVICLPWPRKAELLSVIIPTDVYDDVNISSLLLRNILLGLGDGIRNTSSPKILLAHAQVSGSKTSTGQTLVGCDFEVGIDDLRLTGADFIALGHIHKAQEWPDDWQTHAAQKGDIAYAGSPRRCNFGETEMKSYIIVEFEDNELKTWYRVPTPATKMLHIGARWVHNELFDAELIQNEMVYEHVNESIKDSEIRLRYTVDSEYRESAKRAAQEWADESLRSGALSVKIEEVVTPTTKARAPEIVEVSTLKDKLVKYWEARDTIPEEEVSERLFAKVAELENKDAIQ